ncbi:MAG: hypothetical protein AAF525_07880, partial [Pseudomonadota bacterium]
TEEARSERTRPAWHICIGGMSSAMKDWEQERLANHVDLLPIDSPSEEVWSTFTSYDLTVIEDSELIRLAFRTNWDANHALYVDLRMLSFDLIESGFA